eukprot:GHVN01032627.1.p1 GENE.GHVN01032627.1~~GHVN01032627.1.p1  ORF type:complete len:248 (-),score=41.66 GHVN01032627.1:1530-2273(-)
MFKYQIEMLKPIYRVITYDHRGQGQSEVTDDPAGYDLENLYSDTIVLIEKLNLKTPIHFAGLSMGGFIGLRLASRRPDLIKSLVLMDTSRRGEPIGKLIKYKLMSLVVNLFGIPSIVRPVMEIMFSPSFLNDENRRDEVEYWRGRLLSNAASVTMAVNGVIRRDGLSGDEINKINCPCLILVGSQDRATPINESELMNLEINKTKVRKNCKLIIVDGGGHTSCVEKSDEYNYHILRFLKDQENESSD